MKSLATMATLLFVINVCFGQTDTTFFNSEWEVCNKADAKFYRTIVKENDNFVVSDMYISNKPQMIAVCSNAASPLNKNGLCIYFDKNGNKESYGFFKNNKPIGTWTWYDNDGKDSTVATYKEDGKKEYSRFSRLELEKQKIPGDIYMLAEEMPIFPGGLSAMYEFIANEFEIPKVDRKNKIKGVFYVVTVVNENGEISLLEIKKSLSETLDKEATRVIEKMPKWKAGKMDNKNVKVTLTIPFRID